MAGPGGRAWACRLAITTSGHGRCHRMVSACTMRQTEVREADVSELHLRYEIGQGRSLGGNGGAAADVTRVDETFGS